MHLLTIAAACWSPFLIALGFSRVQRRDDWDRSPQPPTWLFVWLFATVGSGLVASVLFSLGSWREQRRSNGMGWGGPR